MPSRGHSPPGIGGNLPELWSDLNASRSRRHRRENPPAAKEAGQQAPIGEPMNLLTDFISDVATWHPLKIMAMASIGIITGGIVGIMAKRLYCACRRKG